MASSKKEAGLGRFAERTKDSQVLTNKKDVTCHRPTLNFKMPINQTRELCVEPETLIVEIKITVENELVSVFLFSENRESHTKIFCSHNSARGLIVLDFRLLIIVVISSKIGHFY